MESLQATGAVAEREKQIPNALNRLSEATERLLSSFSNLRGEISDILQPEPPSDDPDKKEFARAAGICNIAERIDMSIAELNQLADIINAITQRVEV
jgi:hypothetical protein